MQQQMGHGQPTERVTVGKELRMETEVGHDRISLDRVDACAPTFGNRLRATTRS
jgi:hypothetical protein